MSPAATKGPARRSPGALGLLLWPGAGADRNQPALVAIAETVSQVGPEVRRMDFPYRRAGRRAPDRPPVLMGAVREGAEGLAHELGADTSALLLGGRSMGGRICSMVVADGLAAAGLVLVSYPLHPPGKPERSRTEHFPTIKVPSLFVSGTKDAFGTQEELEAATRAIPGPVTHRWIEGGDHGLRRRDLEVAAIVGDWVRSL